MTGSPMAESLSMVSAARSDGPASEQEMAEWKRLVAVAARSGQALHLHFFGGANQITGYRAYYMLQFAKAAGVAELTLHTDGGFWIDEATDWLSESGVDRIVLYRSPESIPESLQHRIAYLSRHDGKRPDLILAGRPGGRE
jgi:hypothetical protein